MVNNTEVKINQTVAILIDGNNIERSIHEQSGSTMTMVNFDTLIPRLLNNRGLNRLIYFREGKAISSKLAERLYNKFYGSVVPCHKSADIPLSIKATQVSSKVDTIIIMSGDSDYIDLVTHLKSEGVRVEICAVKKTTSHMLTQEADYFHEIVRSDWFEYSQRKKMPFKRLSSLPAQGTRPSPAPVVKPLASMPPSSRPAPTVKKIQETSVSPSLKPTPPLVPNGATLPPTPPKAPVKKTAVNNPTTKKAIKKTAASKSAAVKRV